MDTAIVVIVLITLFAAFVNGAIGYGFSSLTVPIALMFYAARVLNPALVLIELFVNLFVLFLNRGSLRQVWPRVYPIVIGLVPGVALGSYLLTSTQPDWLKFATYALILPMILLQVAGLRRPIRSEKLFGLPFGAGLGVLYSVTTISGPPLAMLFNNQGLVKQDFRAALALIRCMETTLTAFAYWQLGLFVSSSFDLAAVIVPGVLIGIPLGAIAIRRMDAETFRRICMSFDVWIVGFGFARLLDALKLAHGVAAYGPMSVAILLDAWLLVSFFRSRKSNAEPAVAQGAVYSGNPGPA